MEWSNVVVTKQKVTEWEITKTEVGKEMETFLTVVTKQKRYWKKNNLNGGWKLNGYLFNCYNQTKTLLNVK